LAPPRTGANEARRQYPTAAQLQIAGATSPTAVAKFDKLRKLDQKSNRQAESQSR
jgi:hypothetical protein